MKIKIVNQIKKIMRLRQSALEIGNKHEAAHCLRMIERLRTRHGITEEIPLEDHAPDTGRRKISGVPVFSADSPHLRRRRIIWEEILCGTVADFHGCDVQVFKNSNYKIVISQNKDDCWTAINSFHYFFEQGIREAKSYIDNLKTSGKLSSQAARLASQSFLHGFAQGIAQLLGYILNAEDFARVQSEVLSLPEAQPAPAGTNPDALAEAAAAPKSEPVISTSTAIIKSDRILITERAESEEKTEPPKSHLPNPKIEKLDEDALVAGTNAGALLKPSREVLARLDMLRGKIEKIEAARQAEKLKAEKARREREEKFSKAYGFHQITFSGSQSYVTPARGKFRFVIDENED